MLINHLLIYYIVYCRFPWFLKKINCFKHLPAGVKEGTITVVNMYSLLPWFILLLVNMIQAAGFLLIWEVYSSAWVFLRQFCPGIAPPLFHGFLLC